LLEEVMPVGSYATTVRRKALDFAAKIISRGGQIILKVTQAVMDILNSINFGRGATIPCRSGHKPGVWQVAKRYTRIGASKDAISVQKH